MSEGDPKAGISIPVPVYPLYTAIAAEFGAKPVSGYGILSAQNAKFVLFSTPIAQGIQRISILTDCETISHNF